MEQLKEALVNATTQLDCCNKELLKTVRNALYIIGILIILLFVSNMAWLYVFNSYEYVTYEQDGEGINNVNLGEMGDIIGGAESQSCEKEGQIK